MQTIRPGRPAGYTRAMADATPPDSSDPQAAGFLLSARKAQCDPPGSWQSWLFMGGRGAGKTRAGAEWVNRMVRFGGYRRIALIGPTFGDVREVMIEGPSGIRANAPHTRKPPVYEVSRHRLVWPNGAEAHAFSAEDPEALRGPQFDAAWCDELAVWPHADTVWNMLQMTLRLGPAPRSMVTTTPRPVPLIRSLLDDPAVAVTRSRTVDNERYLSAPFLAHMARRYAGTRLGRQELDGEVLEEIEGALWSLPQLERVRLSQHPGPLSDLIVAVDPPVTTGPNADACGIIAAGLRRIGTAPAVAYVLADASVRGLSPLDWAGRVVDTAARIGASRIVAEANQGGELVRSILVQAGCTVPVLLKHARLSKRARAMPVAALYEQGRVYHLGDLAELEAEMCAFATPAQAGSPDRLDALVWAISTLLVEPAGHPSIRRL